MADYERVRHSCPSPPAKSGARRRDEPVAYRERYARVMADAETVARCASEVGARTPDEAINAFQEAVRDGKADSLAVRRETPLPGHSDAQRDIEAFRVLAADMAKSLEEAGVTDPEEAAALIREAFEAENGPPDPADALAGKKGDRLDSFRSWQSKAADYASRNGLSGDEIAREIGKAEAKAKKPRR